MKCYNSFATKNSQSILLLHSHIWSNQNFQILIGMNENKTATTSLITKSYEQLFLKNTAWNSCQYCNILKANLKSE